MSDIVAEAREQIAYLERAKAYGITPLEGQLQGLVSRLADEVERLRGQEEFWAGQEVGGIRISAMSHIEKRLSLALTITRGKRAPYIIEPLGDAPPPAAEPGRASNDQRTEVTKLLAAEGLTSKEAALEWLSESTGRPIVSTADLAADEAARVIEFLRAEQAKDAEAEGGDQ